MLSFNLIHKQEKKKGGGGGGGGSVIVMINKELDPGRMSVRKVGVRREMLATSHNM